MTKKLDIKIGTKFGFLEVIKEEKPRKTKLGHPQRRFKCKCCCGNFSVVLLGDLRSGHTTSCGCKIQENRLKGITKHGMYRTKTHVIWMNMKQRCLNKNSPKFKYYGQRGIFLCKNWWSFEGFLKDMGEATGEMTIERIDNNKGYFKENCIWATRKTQARNRRSNHLITFKNRTQSIAAWAEEFGLNYFTLYMRLARSNWLIERALETPIKKINHGNF